MATHVALWPQHREVYDGEVAFRGLRLIGGTLAAASPAGAQNAPVEDTDTLNHAGENAQTLFSGMLLGAPLFDRPDHDEIEPNALSSLPHPAALPLEVPLTL